MKEPNAEVMSVALTVSISVFMCICFYVCTCVCVIYGRIKKVGQLSLEWQHWWLVRKWNKWRWNFMSSRKWHVFHMQVLHTSKHAGIVSVSQQRCLWPIAVSWTDMDPWPPSKASNVRGRSNRVFIVLLIILTNCYQRLSACINQKVRYTKNCYELMEDLKLQ